jgi:hypothetical protein
MKNALKTILAFAFAVWPACFAQDRDPASPDQPPSAIGTTPVSTANPATGHIPIPKAGDPFFAPIATSGAPQNLQQRFMDYTVVTFGPRALLAPLLGSAITMSHPPAGYTGEWREGMEAYGRIYGSSIATRTSEQTARFLTAAILHEDFRYRPSTSKNPLARSLQAVAFAFVDKSDRGSDRIAISNFAASAVDGFTPNLYLPPGYNNLSRAETRMAIAFGGLAARNLTREFAPDLFGLTRKLHAPFPRVPIPVWWTRRTP